jgi:DNA invertase Pin-like site-specific DNA recombinase
LLDRSHDYFIRHTDPRLKDERAQGVRGLDDDAHRPAFADHRRTETLDGRKGRDFQALDQSGFIESGQSKGLVIAYGDRLARNSWDLGSFYKRMERAGGEIWDASMPGIDYRSPEGRQLTMMRGVANEEKYFSSKRRGDNVADQVVARGVANAVPYGYQRNDGVDPALDAKALVPHAEHAKIVKRIFTLRLEGRRIAEIVRVLNEAGIPSPTGRRWARSSVERILGNEVYTGTVKLGKRRKENAHKALVSPAQWKRAQSTRAVTLSGTYKAGLAGGLVVCASCGGPLKVAGKPGKLTYSCRATGSANGDCSRPVHITKAIADEVVTRAIVEALDKRAFVFQSSGQEVKDAREAITQADIAIAKVLEKADVLTAQELEAALAPKRAAKEAALRRYDEALGQAEAIEGMPESGSAFLEADEIDQRRTARALIEKVTVSPPVAGGTPKDRLDVVFARGG